ncbi:MAG: GMC oxidoreductase [Hyphomonadaceae bacterium]|nr:GMC oxidoreductase [Hyphomonadaceae bacterium]
MTKSISRRAVIKTAALAGAATALPSVNVMGALAATSEPIDTMVIGSGFGGAVAALRMTQAGQDVVMLERGKRWPLQDDGDTFSSLLDPDGRSAWLSDFAILGEPKPIDRYVGVLELIVGNAIAAFAGAGVGGGSLVYAGALYQPPQFLFDRVFDRTVDYWEMDQRYFPRALEVLDARPIPQFLLNQPAYDGPRIWARMARRSGLNPRRIPMGLDWRIVAKELLGKVPPSVVVGDFWYGNNSGAKNTLDRNYLKQAENTGRLSILPQHNVTVISEGPDGRYVVEADEIDENGAFVSKRTYVVSKLFLAAGSIGTSKLLVKAKATATLPKLNDEVGLHWGNNGDFFGAISELPKRIKPFEGGTAIMAAEDYQNSIMPVSVEAFAQWGTEAEEGRIYSIGMAPAPALGSFTYNSETNDVDLLWPAADPRITAINAAGAEAFERLATGWNERGHRPRLAKAVEQRSFGMRPNFRRHRNAEPGPVDASATAHPVGGVVLDRATDNVGQVRNYDGLFVIDGALVPGNTGSTNPALTITALAERNIDRILSDNLVG